MVQEQVLAIEAEKLGVQATDADVAHLFTPGRSARFLFPNGQYIGDDRYAVIIADAAQRCPWPTSRRQ